MPILLFICFHLCFCSLRIAHHAELALPDLVTKFTSSTPARSVNKHHVAPAPSLASNNPADMEFLMPQLPIATSAIGNRLINGGNNSNSSSSTSSNSHPHPGLAGTAMPSLSVSKQPRPKSGSAATSNGSILQSALNTLNSRPTVSATMTVMPGSGDSRRLPQQPLPPVPTMSTAPGSLYTTTADGQAQSKRKYQKQTSVSNVTGAMSAMTLQQSAAHSASASSLTPAASVSATTMATTVLMPPPAAQPKMTKKQLKLAQAQLDKLTQINIHLHGMFGFMFLSSVFSLFSFFFSCWNSVRQRCVESAVNSIHDCDGYGCVYLLLVCYLNAMITVE